MGYLISTEAKAVTKPSNQAKNLTYNQQGAKFGGGFASDGGVQIGGTLNDFSTNIAELTDIANLIQTLKQLAQSFPVPQRDEAIEHLSDLQEDLEQPDKAKPSRIKAALATLLALAIGIGGAVATAAEFTNNILELSNKLGIELQHPASSPKPPSSTQQSAQPSVLDVQVINPSP